ncbi:PilN domain-containing protein [Paenibacillus pini]|uniref:Type IV pilus biogenesis protein PilN n=1 Tax=Paenibacillus pini JCM 16418 TaxID=1236976 RepID=W7YL68_9BACL|nr:hypothetical protein [Paenibacillus pini]GAF09277.1 hypothetical protein JCM16418_3403 [Paenibacillus pini JCM 16418]
MLSNINLLPQREKRSIFFVIVLVAILLIGLVGGGVLFLQYQSLLKEQDRKESEMKTITKLIEMETASLLQAATISEVGKYELLVNTLVELPIQTATILDDMTAALPQSGFFKSYNYQDTGTIEVMAEFGSLEDTAQYLHHLSYADWVQKVEIISIARQENGSQGLYEAHTLSTLREMLS